MHVTDDRKTRQWQQNLQCRFDSMFQQMMTMDLTQYVGCFNAHNSDRWTIIYTCASIKMRLKFSLQISFSWNLTQTSSPLLLLSSIIRNMFFGTHICQYTLSPTSYKQSLPCNARFYGKHKRNRQLWIYNVANSPAGFLATPRPINTSSFVH